MKHFKIFTVPNGVLGILNIDPGVDVYTYQFIYDLLGKEFEGPDWYLAKHYRSDTIDVPQLKYCGTNLCIKNLINEITSEGGYYAILNRDHNSFGLAWAAKPFIGERQEYVI